MKRRAPVSPVVCAQACTDSFGVQPDGYYFYDEMYWIAWLAHQQGCGSSCKSGNQSDSTGGWGQFLDSVCTSTRAEGPQGCAFVRAEEQTKEQAKSN